MTFVGFAKAFDLVDHSSLWSLLRHYVVPDKIVRMIKVMYEGFKASVIHEGSISHVHSEKRLLEGGGP